MKFCCEGFPQFVPTVILLLKDFRHYASKIKSPHSLFAKSTNAHVFLCVVFVICIEKVKCTVLAVCSFSLMQDETNKDAELLIVCGVSCF